MIFNQLNIFIHQQYYPSTVPFKTHFLKKNAPIAAPIELKNENTTPLNICIPKKSLAAFQNPCLPQYHEKYPKKYSLSSSAFFFLTSLSSFTSSSSLSSSVSLTINWVAVDVWRPAAG